MFLSEDQSDTFIKKMMIMKKFLLFLPMLCVFALCKGQQIAWPQINSTVAIDMFHLQQMSLDSLGSVVVQQGDKNNATILMSSQSEVTVRQDGRQNNVYFNNTHSAGKSSTAIATMGYNNTVDFTGTNSISDGIKMNVKGENVTVFVRNY
ncbi:hypothetical protein DQ356_00620 [Chryseobacterium lacus]|uniref:Uncharacterized protein n=2 Tax=Chryseobacterium lacus TaxID=2058346 RepID=A0A368N2H6_9FLAO|nr:hypothetical protein DQ356_00620 [Chryseobacterium lacus]